MTKQEQLKLLSDVNRNLYAVLEFGQMKHGYFCLPPQSAPALEGVLYALRRMCVQLGEEAMSEQLALDEFAKGNEKRDPEAAPF